MELLPTHKKSYLNHLRGDEGELDFIDRLVTLPKSCLVLNDLWLRFDSTAVQIDGLVLAGRMLYLHEVKNYSGHFYYEAQQLFLNRSGEEIFSPLNQIDKNRILLKNFLKRHGFPFHVAPHVIFINPAFHMYQSPRDQPFVFYNQLDEHLRQVAAEGEVFPHFAPQHRQLAEKLLTLRYEEEVRYENFPAYSFASLKKGVTCRQCHSFALRQTRQNSICVHCGCVEAASQTITRATEEFMLLFPNSKVTKNAIYDWCGEVYDKQRIQRTLQRYFSVQGKGKSSFYL